MLTQLTVSNYAIAESLELQFHKGMTTLTGETGAGKSIVLDALSLVLGGRADANAVRHGARRADITASFDVSRIHEAQAWLEAHDLDDDSDCILRRVISRDGRSRAYINGQPCPLTHLKALGGQLMDIHSQHQHQSLLRRETHRKLLDEFAGATELAQATASAWKEWQQIRQRLNALQTDKDENDARLQLLRYQVEELDRLALEPDELTGLEQAQAQLSHAETVLKGAHQASQLCSENDTSAASLLRQALQQIEQLPVEVAQLSETVQMLNEAEIQLTEAGSNLRHFTDHYEADPERLKDVEQRLSTIYDLARKHRVQPGELGEHHGQLAEELARLDDGEDSLEKLTEQAENQQNVWQKTANALSDKRHAAAAQLDERIAAELTHLNMPAVQFVTRLEKPSPGSSGAQESPRALTPRIQGHEDVEFLISANPGQPARALSKVASGGELSRISLAIQVVAAQTSTIPTLIFDEVDVGIGGGTAEVVGRLLRQLGDNGQVLCVTHLPQVAAQAHQHLFVSKFCEKESTFSRIEALNENGRVQEVARMLGGVDLTEQTLAHAQEMFQRGQATQH